MPLNAMELVERLREHLSRPEYIKGWEVDKRTCVGPQRQALRKAARHAKGATQFGDVGERWVAAFEALRVELAKAGEADFDGLLSEAFATLQSYANLPDHKREEAPAPSPDTCVDTVVAAAARHLERRPLRTDKRDYGVATQLADLARSAGAAYGDAIAAAQKAERAYAAAVDSLREELEAIGESDFDGIMRKAVATLKRPPTDGARPAALNESSSASPRAPSPQASSPHPPSPQPPPSSPRAIAPRLASPPGGRSPRAPASSTETPLTPQSVIPLTAAEAPKRFAHVSAPERVKDADAAVPPPPKTKRSKPRARPAVSDTAPPLNAAPAPLEKTSPAPVAAPAPAAIPALRVETIDDGCVRLGRLPPTLQAALLREAFQEGAKGVCGGLAEGGCVSGGHGADYHPVGTSTTDWYGLGLHGCHAVDYVEGGAAASVLAAVRAAAPALPAAARERLDAFEPSCLRTAFESMGGRRISPRGSLCGWSPDRLRTGDDDGTLKLMVLLGGAESVRESFKYSKADREALHVSLRPGEILLTYGEARGWVSAITAHTPGDAESDEPFDFMHLGLLDLRQFAASKSKNYARLLAPPRPKPLDHSWKWMQCAYTIAAICDDGSPVIELSGHNE